jgi:small subunit ribosomal protein S13
MAKKTEEFGDDFRFLVRISATDLDGKKSIAQGLTGLKGVNNRLSRIIAKEAELVPAARLGDITDAQLANLIEVLDHVEDFTPVWMRNRRMDPETGDDMHVIGSEINMLLRDDLNRLKKIRSWRGVRHEANLPTRGQRTKANGRFGNTVGVQRRKK